jgi:hypothetical protein
LGQKIAADESTVVPHALSVNDLRDWARQWGDLILQEGADAPVPIRAVA